MRNERETAVASVRRASTILAMFLEGHRGLGVTQVAGRLGVSNSTAHRLLRTLCDGGLLEQNPVTRRYELSLVVHRLGNRAARHSDLRRRGQLALERLHAATGEGCHIAIADFPEVLYMERRDSQVTMRFIGRMGMRAPANCTSTGKVLLAEAPADQQEQVLAAPLERLTRRSLTDAAKLREHLVEIRERGYAQSQDEMEIGITSLAAPIRDGSGGVVAALGLAGPTARLRRLAIPRVRDAVLEASAALSFP